MTRSSSRFVRGLRALALPTVCAVTATLPAQESWTNYGGNGQRNGLSNRFGPTAATQLWSNTTDFSLISWAPFVDGERVFTVRQSAFPSGSSAGDAIVAYDLETGVEQWRTTLPFTGTASQWIAWIGGVSNGRVYCSRSDNGRAQPLMALDAATGATVWTSTLQTNTWAHEGLVFTANGDIIIGDRNLLARLDGATGATVWDIPRNCSVSGNCGPALFGDAVYFDEVASGGQRIVKIDALTGNRLYESPVMPGGTSQNQPFVSPDGQTVYMARSQNNPAVDQLYAFLDNGTGFTQLWTRDVRWTTRHEHGIGADGTIYTFLPGDEFVGLDPVTGNTVFTAGVLGPIGTNLSPHTAIGADGTVYVSNGWASSPASDGRLWAFSANLGTQLFVLNLDRQNAGGPVLAGQGELVVCDRSGVYCYRQPGPDASATPRNGTGINQVAFTAVAEPEIYRAFQGQVATTPSTALTFVMYGFGPPPVPIVLFGDDELLVDLAFLPIQTLPGAAGGLHSLPIPGNPILNGAAFSVQGARFSGAAGFEFGNALDLVLGY